ncbi:winged helix-turn-helix domain-containing protein [Halarcobacter sp.]|uniref:response regulator transcription factor n=1 Tax=Halarcobacter sp. TaxID=2321133 RepID=UPI002AABB361|nr:winged helix-turn-helix domain-containing protein [Halarcobacter sp.]
MTMKASTYQFVEDKSVLVIGKDNSVNKRVKRSLADHISNIDILTDIPSYLNLSKYDLVIIDIEYYDNKDLVHTFSNDFYNTPIIFLTSDVNSVDFNALYNISVKNILQKDETLNNIFIYSYIILQKKDKLIFKNGYLYSLKDNRFYYQNREVALTKLELKLFEFLVKNINRIISYEEIREKVWDNNSCTIYSVRNVINKIREKSYYEIISNFSKQGYTINNDYIYI